MSHDNYEIHTKQLSISGNVMKFPDYFIQLSSVAQVSTSPARKQEYPRYALVCVAIGVLMLLSKQGTLLLVGLVLIGFGGWTMYQIHQSNTEAGNDVYLQLNSGTSFTLNCPNKETADRIMTALSKCVNTRDENLTINCMNGNVSVNGSNVIQS